jgi:hypothetical protein
MSIKEENDDELDSLDKIHDRKLEEKKRNLKNQRQLALENKVVEMTLYKSGQLDKNTTNGVAPEKPTDIDGLLRIQDDGTLITKEINPNLIYQEKSNMDQYYHVKEIEVSSSEGEEENQYLTILNRAITKETAPKDIYAGVLCAKSCIWLTKHNKIRILCAILGSHKHFETVVIILIVLSSLKLVAETYQNESWPPDAVAVLNGLDYVFNGLFIMEAVIKIIRMGFCVCPESY